MKFLFFSAIFWSAFSLQALPTFAEETEIDYRTEIEPIFKTHCYACHGEEEQESGYRLDSGAFVIEGGERGTAVIPGKSRESLLFLVITGTADDVSEMPAEGDLLSEEQIELIRQWIDQGAAYPDEQASLKRRSQQILKTIHARQR